MSTTLQPPAPLLPRPADDALQSLRKATAALHLELDANLPLAQPGAGLADYAWHLRVLQSWLRGLVPRMAPLSGLLAGEVGPPPPRLDWLAQDLAACPPGLRGDTALPVPTLAMPPRRDEQAYAWGLSYVVEGSALGGQVLHRRLAEALAPHPLRYLLGQGAETGRRWRAFTTALQCHVRAADEVAVACAAAVGAFESLQRLYALRQKAFA